ncbi:MAG: hypothetical protein A3F41_00335 [Coxiella sp. RIFCSPHIGHO2_12_FULL_44_14]|nr:MAG: hypothetical protein A3F41_00335 [Coxiella sp. RIFCSPHIGHO2_12_FULL_44_14]
MRRLATTKLSSKGQIVIPEEIRDKLGLHSGDKFIVIAEKDVIILKSIEPPSMKDFDRLITEVRKAAKESGLKKQDIQNAIKIIRRKK